MQTETVPLLVLQAGMVVVGTEAAVAVLVAKPATYVHWSGPWKNCIANYV